MTCSPIRISGSDKGRAEPNPTPCLTQMSGISDKLLLCLAFFVNSADRNPGDGATHPAYLFVKLYLFSSRFTKCISECLWTQLDLVLSRW